MPKSPFDLDEGFENIPVVKAPAQAVKQATKTVAKGTAQQAKKAAQAFVKQLYGAGGSPSATDDQQSQQVLDKNVDPVGQTKKNLTTPVYFHSTTQSKTGNANPTNNPVARTTDEQEEIQKTREMLFRHKQGYYDATLGKLSDIEQDVEKKRKEREQEELQKKKEEEEEELRKKQEKEQREQQALPMPTGKGRNRMGQKKMPLAAERARTKTESKVAGAG